MAKIGATDVAVHHTACEMLEKSCPKTARMLEKTKPDARGGTQCMPANIPV